MLSRTRFAKRDSCNKVKKKRENQALEMAYIEHQSKEITILKHRRNSNEPKGDFEIRFTVLYNGAYNMTRDSGPILGKVCTPKCTGHPLHCSEESPCDS